MRICSNCGAQAGYHKQICEACGERLPKAHAKSYHCRTPRGQQRVDAQVRMLAGMRGPACVCGCRGPHECTRTTEWKQETFSLLSMRQL
jgi:hypothetical protein